jgi:hypothetical protein
MRFLRNSPKMGQNRLKCKTCPKARLHIRQLATSTNKSLAENADEDTYDYE